MKIWQLWKLLQAIFNRFSSFWTKNQIDCKFWHRV